MDKDLYMKLINKATELINIDENIESNLYSKIEAIAILNFLRNPINFYNKNRINILLNSDFFLEVMDDLKEDLVSMYDFNSLKVINKIMNYIFVSINDIERQERVLEIGSVIENRTGKMEVNIIKQINENPLKYFKTHPKTFLANIPNMDASKYSELILNNKFVELVDKAISIYNFNEEEIDTILKIFRITLSIYEIRMTDLNEDAFEDDIFDEDMAREKLQHLSHLSYLRTEKEISEFDYEAFDDIYELLIEQKEKEKEKRK